MNKLKQTFIDYVYNAEEVKTNIIRKENKEELDMKNNFIIIGGILAVAAIVTISYIGLANNNKDKVFEVDNSKKEPLSFVTISINPDVQLGLDENDKVVEVNAVNSDADVLTSDLNLIGLDANEASNKVIDAAMETGYLDEYSDENAVVVTTVNDNEENRKALEQKIITKMNEHFETRKIYPVLVAKGLDDNLKAEADKYNISYGKMLLIESALALNNTLSKDQLINMSIKDIQNEIRSYIKNRHNALKESLQDAKAKWKEEKAQLKENYLSKVKALKESITEEHKEEFKNMTPAQKKEAIQNYLNTRKQQIKENINAVKGEIKTDVKEDMKDYNYPVIENNSDKIKENVKERIEQRRNNK
jgi:hypothetical protein